MREADPAHVAEETIKFAFWHYRDTAADPI